MKELAKFETQTWSIGLEFKLQDFWVGAFWDITRYNGDIWICLIPMFPIHIEWWGR